MLEVALGCNMRKMAVFLAVLIVAPAMASAEQNWPGEPVDNHIYMSWAALTQEVNQWADDNPDIVQLSTIGQSFLGKELWMVVLSDWSMETKSNGSAKEIIYIDGGHHGNEYLGTALAWLTAKWYINEWNAQNEKAVNVLQNTELHIMIMLNPDGNDFDTRHNQNLTTAANPFASEPVPTGIDLNRNYDHFWDDCSPSDPFAPGTGPFSEPETKANAEYMNSFVQDADLYVTMHTGVWIILYPWGKWPQQPPDWELFHGIRDDINSGISDIPIQNANQGLYPNCGTSRDYGYGVMGIPTFTFETDDDQFLPGTFEDVNDRLDEELDVMHYLIDNIWYWRARLVEILRVSMTEKYPLQLIIRAVQVLRTQHCNMLMATKSSRVKKLQQMQVVQFQFQVAGLTKRVGMAPHYQKRVVHSSQWVNESVNLNPQVTTLLSELVETLLWILQAGEHLYL